LAYRGLDHSTASERLDRAAQKNEFGTPISTFATAFSMLQGLRHSADYDPRYRVSRAEAVRYINEAERAIVELASAEAGDILRMALTLLVRPRGRR
jgi:hypothetical protein